MHISQACGIETDEPRCCGLDLLTPFAMTNTRVIALRRYVHGRKGLDEPTYRLHLRAVGADSTLHLTSTQYDALLARLRPLPDRQQRSNAAAGTKA